MGHTNQEIGQAWRGRAWRGRAWPGEAGHGKGPYGASESREGHGLARLGQAWRGKSKARAPTGQRESRERRGMDT